MHSALERKGMRRTTLNEQQKAAALLIGLGQFDYRHIAKQVGVHRNSIGNWLRDERFQRLVAKFQNDIERKFADMTVEAVHRKHGLLFTKAVEKLEAMLESKSQKRQMQVIKFLLESGALDDVIRKKQGDQQGEQFSPLRLDPELRSRLRVTQS
jgi:hypothetical protein